MHAQAQSKVSFQKKLILILFGLFLTLIILELGLRLGGFIIVSLQEHRNLQAIKQKGTYRIMCLGESTTAWGGEQAWPYQLERILNSRNTGIRFSVINQGRYSIQSSAILLDLEANLSKYHPDMVIAMMGINDGEIMIPFENSFALKAKTFFVNFRIYKLARLLRLHLLSRLATRVSAYLSEDSSYSNIDSGTQMQDRNSSMPFPHTEGDGSSIAAKASEQTVRESESYLNSGILYRVQGKHEEAEKMLKKAIESDPWQHQSYIELSTCYIEQKRYAEVENMLKERIREDPQNSQNEYVMLSRCYREQGTHPLECEELLKKAIELQPDYSGAYFDLGQLYKEQRNYQEAERMFQKAVEIDLKYNSKDSQYSIIALGACYFQQKDFKKLRELLNLIARYTIENDRLYSFCGIILQAQGQYREAAAYFQRAEKLRGKYYSSITCVNFRKMRELVYGRRIPLACVQYPMRSVEPLKKILEDNTGRQDLIFVDNGRTFKEAVAREGYGQYFCDMFAGDFGHCTDKGNRLLAENIANVILKEVFGK